jgi:hypothetical protein
MEVHPCFDDSKAADQGTIQIETGRASQPHKVVRVAGRALSVEASNLLSDVLGQVHDRQLGERTAVAAVDRHVHPRTYGGCQPRRRPDVDLRAELTGGVRPKLAPVDDRVAAATVFDVVGERTKASAVDLTDE